MSPKLFNIRKFKLRDLVAQNYNMIFDLVEEQRFYVKQQHNQLFRHINLITQNDTDYVHNMIFVDCKGSKDRVEELTHIFKNGFHLNGVHFKLFGKSASMSRNGIVGFVSSDIHEELEKIAMMDLDIKEIVISKFEAYKNLLLSSCFFIEEKLPYIVIINDYEKVIPNCHIKYVVEKEIDYEDKKTKEKKKFVMKDIEEGYKDVDIIPADGAGIHTPDMSELWSRSIGINHKPSVFMIRMPYVKGLSIEVDFKKFYKLKGIEYITDIWGKQHRVEDIDCIWTKSLYKGYGYFKTHGDYRDWEIYLEKFYKYNHILGISKWNFTTEEEPIYTRINYQYLQTLSMDKDKMIELAEYSKNWVEKIVNGDYIYTYKLLGMAGNNVDASNKYMKAVSLHSDMLKDVKIRQYLLYLLEKYIDEFKMGKLWIKGCFKIAIPDIIMLMEYAGGLEPVGCLKYGEFYGRELNSDEYLIDRNPHICSSEHTILKSVNNQNIKEYLGHLENVCMLNSCDITMKRLNGCDFDGDLVFVTDNEIMMNGVNRGLPIVIDVDDKITALKVEYTIKNIIQYMLMSLDNRIGEISNVATCYLNKQTKNEEQIKKYNDYVCLLSVINGKEIDYAKTGTRWNIPYHIAKFARPLPYFMKYAGKYYKTLKKFSKSRCNLNYLCWDVEKWQKKLNWEYEVFNNSNLMSNPEIPWDNEKFEQIHVLFKEFQKESSEAKKQQHMLTNWEDYINYFKEYTKSDIINTDVNWEFIYNKYRNKASKIVPNEQELANYAIDISYNKYPKKSKNFAWVVAENGILANLTRNRQQNISFPVRAEENEAEAIEYLGKYYKIGELFNV